ncbi:MAG: ribokinase [Pseudomonadota bacterium]|nr:ribokinase [Pseudomonadota bacterium]
MVIVFGSINLDLVTRVARFPKPGETIGAESFATYPGGKGANQALAAARAGVAVRLYGAVGTDAFADTALGLLAAAGIDLDGVKRAAAPTGCATILVDARGENCIAVVSGANEIADPEAVPDSVLVPGTLVVLQHEVPARANAVLIARAHRGGARIMLNAAPARPLPIELLRQIDVLVVNQTEAAALAAANGWPTKAQAFAAAVIAVTAPTFAVVVTLGKEGALAASGNDTMVVQAPDVEVIDTTGAGDAFVGALAAAIDAHAPLPDALRAAVAAGSLACTTAGAQPALPRREAIVAALRLVTARVDRRC